MKWYLMWFVAVLNCVWPVQAQTVKLIAPFSAGSNSDVIARVIEKQLNQEHNLKTIVEYKLGAGGNVAAEYVSSYAGKDTVLLITTSAVAINSANKTLALDPVQDLMPVAYLGTVPMVLVSNNQFAYKNLRDWPTMPLDTAITYASAGIGSANHLNGDFLKNATKKNLVHIPYKGGSAMVPDLIGGRVDIAFPILQNIEPLIKTGKLTALAVVSDKRLPEIPNVPTFAELGYANFGFETWVIVFANPTADPVLVLRVQQILAGLLSDPEKSQLFKQAGLQLNVNQTLLAKDILTKSMKSYQDYFQRYGYLQ